MWLAAWLACSVFGTEITERTVPAACGACTFKQPIPACYWAVEIDGGIYAVNGKTPADHDAHGPEGMCRMRREAVVAGTLRGDTLYATKFELLPVAPGTPPAPEHAHTH